MLTLSESQATVLEALERYGLLTSQMVRQIVKPELGQEWTRRRLNALERRGLAACAERRSSHQRVWFVTQDGRHSGGSTRPPMTVVRATGGLQAHDLEVNEAALAFLKAARGRGHDAAWRREVVHKLANSRRLVVDALLEYREPRYTHYQFLEVDRGTEMLHDLMGKLDVYAEFHRSDLWRRLYPTFPSILLIFSGKPRPELERRLESISALVSGDNELKEIDVSFTLLSDLGRLGPYEPIFTLPGQRGRVTWLGDSVGLRVAAG